MRDLAGILVALVALGGCAALAPDRTLQSTMTLAPGQTATGSIEIPDGGRGLAQFWQNAPRKVGSADSAAVVWTGGGDVLLAFPDSRLPAERPLGYSHQWLEDGSKRRVVVRNVSERPATFTWVVKGSSD